LALVAGIMNHRPATADFQLATVATNPEVIFASFLGYRDLAHHCGTSNGRQPHTV
jgi:hypothetical protein